MRICTRLEEVETIIALRNKAVTLLSHPLNFEEQMYVSTMFPVNPLGDGVNWDINLDALTLAHLGIVLSERPGDAKTKHMYRRITSLYEEEKKDYGISRNLSPKVEETLAHLSEHRDACCTVHNSHAMPHRKCIMR